MTDVKANAEDIRPIGGTGLKNRKIGFIENAAKAAQNDTVTVSNAATVVWAALTIDATGAAEPHTISGKAITLTSATTGAVSGIVIYT